MSQKYSFNIFPQPFENIKRTHGHGQHCGDCWQVGCIRGLNGNGKQYNKDFFKTFLVCGSSKTDWEG